MTISLKDLQKIGDIKSVGMDMQPVGMDKKTYSIKELQGLGDIRPAGAVQPQPSSGFFSGLGQGLAGEASTSDIPFIGTGKEAIELGKIAIAYNKIKNKKGTDQDKKLLLDFYNEETRLAELRQNKGFRVGETIRKSATFMGELLPVAASEFFTATLAPSGEAYAALKITEKGTLAVLKKALKDKATKEIVKKYAKELSVKGSKTLAKQVAVTSIARVPKGTAERMIGVINPNTGEVLEEGQKISGAIINALSGHTVEIATELGGGVSGKGLKFLTKPVRNYVTKSAIYQALKKKFTSASTEKVAQLLSKTGWNGVMGEWFEERDADILNNALEAVGLGDQDFQGLTLDDITTELAAFGLMGGAISGTTAAFDYSRGRTEEKQIDKQVQEFTQDEADIEVDVTPPPVAPPSDVEVDVAPMPAPPVATEVSVAVKPTTEIAPPPEPIKPAPVTAEEFVNEFKGKEILDVDGEKLIVDGFDGKEIMMFNSKENKTSLLEIDEANDLISRQDEIKNKIKINEKQVLQNELDKQKQENIKKEEETKFKNDDGYTDDMVPVQKAKVLDSLNKKVTYQGESFTRKDFVKELLNNRNGILSDKNGKYRINFKDNPEGVDITKTEYDYAKFLETKPKEEGLTLEVVKQKEGEEPAPKTTISRTQLKQFYKNTPEFQENPVLTVEKKTITHTNEYRDPISSTGLVLSFKGKTQQFSIVPGALGLKTENLKIGDKIRLDPKTLKIPGTNIRVIKTAKSGARATYASFAKEGADFEFTQEELNNIGDPKVYKKLQDKLPRRSEIVKNIAETLNVPIRRGNFRHPGAAAIFKPKERVIRYKKGGVSTVFHEMAHYLDEVYGFHKYFIGKGKVGMRKQLMEEYAVKYDNKPKTQAKEAFAEFVRFYMTGRKQKVKKIAPGFYAEFEKRIDAMPEVKNLITAASEDFKRWTELPAAARVLSQMSDGKKEKKLTRSFLSEKIHQLYTNVKDDLHPIAQFVKTMKDAGVKVLDEANPYILARISRGWAGAANVFLNEGTFGKNYYKVENGKTKVVFKGKSLKAILMPIQVSKQLTNFKIYLTSKRAAELHKRGVKSGISVHDAKQVIEEYETKYPTFKKAAEELYTYQNQLLELMNEEGMLSDSALTEIQKLNRAYIPFYRVMEELDGEILKREGGVGKKFAENVSPIKKIFGSDREIIDPLESVIKNTYSIINSVKRYQVVRALVELADKNYKGGRLVEKIDAPQRPIEVNVKEVLKKAMGSMLQKNVEVQEMMDNFADELEEVVTLFRPARSFGSENIIDIAIGEKRGYYRIDPALYRSLQGIDNESIGMITKALAIPAKTLRGGAILTPEFSVRNPLRDTFMAAVYSKFGYVPGYDMFRGMFKVVRNYSTKTSDLYTLWKISGGDQSSLASMDRTTIKKNLDDILASRGKKGLKYIKNPLEALRILSELGEESTRLIEMESALKSSGNPVAAAFASREVTLDFWRKGAKMKSLTRVTAFMGPQIEGIDKMIREAKEHPVRFNMRALTYITLPSVLLWLVNHDDERYKEIPMWQKNLFWIIITDEHIYRIPKPFELGLIYGSTVERILDYTLEKDPKAIEGLRDSLVKGIMPPLLPTALVPAIEAQTNHSFFLDRAVVSPGVEGLPAEAQYKTYTSETAKYLGKILNYSPMKVDHMIRGYFAGLGQHFSKMIDYTLRKAGIVDTPLKVDKEGADMPVLKAFMVREPIGSGSESVTRFYDLQKEADSKKKLYLKLRKENKVQEAKDYLEANPIIKISKNLTSIRSNFSIFNDKIEEIRMNEDLTPTERKDAIDEINELMNEWAQKALTLYSK